MARAKKTPAKSAGVKRAAEIANAAMPLPIADLAEQIDMLDGLGAPINRGVQKLRAKQVGPGRPAGALNRRTTEMAEYLLSRYTSPLEVLAQIATARIDELSASLGCTKLEALQEKRLAAIALKDHVHSKMPVAIDVTDRKVVYLTIFNEEPPASSGVGLVDDVLDLTARELPPARSASSDG